MTGEEINIGWFNESDFEEEFLPGQRFFWINLNLIFHTYLVAKLSCSELIIGSNYFVELRDFYIR